MEKLKTLRMLEEELGEVLHSGMSGEYLYYCAEWEEIRELSVRKARKQHAVEPNDVRAANYALDLLGIPSQYTEADQDETGDWVIYWR